MNLCILVIWNCNNKTQSVILTSYTSKRPTSVPFQWLCLSSLKLANLVHYTKFGTLYWPPTWNRWKHMPPWSKASCAVFSSETLPEIRLKPHKLSDVLPLARCYIQMVTDQHMKLSNFLILWSYNNLLLSWLFDMQIRMRSSANGN